MNDTNIHSVYIFLSLSSAFSLYIILLSFSGDSKDYSMHPWLFKI